MADDTTHHYVSTACHHGIHYRCRTTCKFCRVDCACPCHEAERKREEAT